MLGVNTPALPASLRRTNQRTVISLLLRLGCASRASLAKAAGISQPTAGKITAELLKLGVLEEAGLGPSQDSASAHRLGRPGQLLRLDSHHARFLAIELGVSQTRVAALPVAVRLDSEWTVQFPTPKSPEAWLRELKLAAEQVPAAQLWGALVSVPGIVDEAAGKVLYAPNLHWLEKTNLPELVRKAWNLPVLMTQEIRALALGHLTAEPGENDFFLADFGQGVGGAIVLNGRLYSHLMPFSGEFGHTPVAGNSRRCGCGAVGCLETLVSLQGLLETFGQAFPEEPKNWKALAHRVVDHGIEPWLAPTLSATARGIAGALNTLGIHRVVITGLLAELPECVMDQLVAEATQGALWGRFGEVRCEIAPRRRAAGLVALGIDRLVLPADEEPAAARQRPPQPASAE